MDIPADIPLGPPSQSKNGTGTLIVLFSPSPRSFYRVKEFTDLETAKKFCEAYAAEPSILQFCGGPYILRQLSSRP